MADYEKLMEYHQLMCDALNNAGIVRERAFPELKFEVNEYLWTGCICYNMPAFNYLKQKGLLDMGICPECGEHPIGKEYQFTSGFNPNIKYYICKNCYSRGVNISTNPLSDKKGCYIATACYHDFDSEEVMVFRNYRDDYLETFKFGRLCIYAYYKISPYIADRIAKNSRLNIFIRKKVMDKLYNKLKAKYN